MGVSGAADLQDGPQHKIYNLAWPVLCPTVLQNSQVEQLRRGPCSGLDSRASAAAFTGSRAGQS